MQLENKIAAVTGGTAGIGRSITEAFLREGASVSIMARNAEKAERDALNHLKCEFANENIGNSFKGQITGVTNFGLFIHLLEVNIEGLCHIKHLPKNEYYVYNEPSQMLQSNSSKHSYSLGDFL